MATRWAAATASMTDGMDTLADEVHTQVGALTSNAAASPVTLTAAQMLVGVLKNTTNGAITFNTPTAAALVAAMPNAQVGSTFVWFVRNDGNGTLTVSAGTNVTIDGTATIATTLGQVFVGKLTNVTATSEAVTLFAVHKVAS